MLKSYWNVTENKRLNNLVGGCLILSFLIEFLKTLSRCIIGLENINTWGYSEFLINLQGGFVRRGLVGELLYQFCSWLHITPLPLITPICYGVFLFVVAFFIYKFYKRNYCWWILLSPLFLNFTHDIIRKDFILYALLIGCIYILRRSQTSVTNRYFACILVVLGLFIHEAFLFWGFPIYAIIVLSYGKEKFVNYILVLIPLLVFVILSMYKGSINVVYGIIESWNQILPDAPLCYEKSNSIGALGWDTRTTFNAHIAYNINVSEYGYGIVLLPFYTFVAYYMFTNFLSAFGKTKNVTANTNKLAISLLYSMSILCLIPMFTVLSCDTGRNFQYAAIVTFSAFLILPSDMIIKTFPKWYVNAIKRINSNLDRFMSPSKGLLIILLLFVGMSPYWFSLQTCWNHSVIGCIWSTTFHVIDKIFTCLVH